MEKVLLPLLNAYVSAISGSSKVIQYPLLFLVGMLDTFQDINLMVDVAEPQGSKGMHTTAFADDISLTGKAQKLLNLIPRIKQLIPENTCMELVPE